MENIQEEIEDKVIDCINSGVGGRLIIYKPEKRGLEDFLVVERRGQYKGNNINFQINSLVLPSKNISFVKDFVQEDFKTDKNFYLLFVYFDEVKQDINDYVWLIPSIQFKDIAKVVKSSDGKNLLRFKSSSNFKEKNIYSKFLVNIKELGDIILDSLKNNASIIFKATDFEDKSTINLETLEEFICTARRNTFAADSTGIDNPRLLKSTQLEFQKASYFYRDIYFNGNKKFIGQEIVYQDLKPVWGMNYVGSQIGKLETSFLKESLLKLSKKCRLGQTCDYKKREYTYQDKGQGNLEEFSGTEEILLDSKSIYKLNYQGGLISDK